MNIKSALTPITTVSQAKTFMDEVLALLGDGFHPDTDFIQYENGECGGTPVFSHVEATILNGRMNEVFELFGDEELMYKVLLPETGVGYMDTLEEIADNLLKSDDKSELAMSGILHCALGAMQLNESKMIGLYVITTDFAKEQLNVILSEQAKQN